MTKYFYLSSLYQIILPITALFILSINGQIVRIVHKDGAGHLNTTSDQHRIMLEDKCSAVKPCVPGLILPVWGDPIAHPPSFATKILKAAVYLVAMMYLFLGVSIVADRFMAAIEVITSQERELTIVNANGEPTIVLVRIWNETVSNLTLMALGSSAPEILLSVIEIFANNFEAGDLGPGTIVGSAAFNLFCIVAICIAVIPSGESRRIERNDVFWVTVVWSTFAYVWLYLILCVFSPNIVEVWEGLLTFFFFFLTVLSAYVANRYAPSLGRRILGKNLTGIGRASNVAFKPGEKSTAINLHVDNPDQKSGEMLLDGAEDHKQALIDPNIVAFQEHRSRFIRNFQQMRLEHPDLPLKQIGRMATFKSLAEAPKSRAFRRVEATRQLTAACTPTKRLQSASSIDYGNDEDRIEPLITSDRTSAVKISFKPSHYICAEDVGILKLYVKCDRSAVQIPNIVTVNYYSVPGSAKEHEDFEPCRGSITFAPDQDYQEIHIKIVDNDVYEFDEEFYVRLTTPKAIVATNTSEEVPAELGTASEALIIIVDDDHGGHFGFGSQVYRVNENEGYFYLTVNRQRGARGKVVLPYSITEGRAKRGIDFNCEDGELIFYDRQTTAQIRIEIINDDRYEKSEDFYVQLGQPVWESGLMQSTIPTKKGEDVADGRPFLSDNSRCKIIIKEDDELKSFVDRLIARANSSLVLGTSSWRQQFQEALSVSGEPKGCSTSSGDQCVVDGLDSAQNSSSLTQKFMHFLCLPWKLLFACIPPTDYAHGWVCFCVAIIFIGLLTAVIGDVAAMFGCTIGLKDTVTAITLVALGTSIPDTFASKLAAVQDKTADSSIGNVTGSNAVNVFLGIGVAWAIAAIYHAKQGTVFHVHAGSLATSVALFLMGSVICISILQIRRFSKSVHAELGGPAKCKWMSSIAFFFTWIVYITYCTLDAYCVI